LKLKYENFEAKLNKELMKRQQLLDLLDQHQPFDDIERQMTAETIDFVRANSDCFERSLTIGHVTGSAWILDEVQKNVLLMHHRKLNRWFQPGGHADGESDVLKVALKEAQEETGLTDIQVVSDSIFDIDIHQIPENPKEAAHYHYDIRFLFLANKNAALQINAEANNLSWVKLNEVSLYNDSDSILRMVQKSC
jgi:8-oxo-dGTP pyrophosphatase MutT (NUDIX family)